MSSIHNEKLNNLDKTKVVVGAININNAYRYHLTTQY